MKNKCPICKRLAKIEPSGISSLDEVTCFVCGKYKITCSARAIFADYSFNEEMCNVSGYLRNTYDRHQRVETIDSNLFKKDGMYFYKVLPSVPRGALEIQRNILSYVHEVGGRLGRKFSILSIGCQSIGYCWDHKEFMAYLYYLKEKDFLGVMDLGAKIELRLKMAGQIEIDKFSSDLTAKSQAFVAMDFRNTPVEVFTEGISPLSSTESTGYNVKRIDYVEHNGDIVDEIILEISRSRFVIADVSENNKGVFFEAGYAMGLNIPVIWTCQKEKFENGPHFDTNHFNHILWEDVHDLRSRLEKRILAIFGHA